MTTQEDDFHLGKNAILEFYQDETIPYKDACYHQKTIINMEKGLNLFWQMALQKDGLQMMRLSNMMKWVYKQKLTTMVS